MNNLFNCHYELESAICQLIPNFLAFILLAKNKRKKKLRNESPTPPTSSNTTSNRQLQQQSPLVFSSLSQASHTATITLFDIP